MAREERKTIFKPENFRANYLNFSIQKNKKNFIISKIKIKDC
jgi:hypothetical protein